jgi:prenylcysteine oxidase/farnesylcysteine lyase
MEHIDGVLYRCTVHGNYYKDSLSVVGKDGERLEVPATRLSARFSQRHHPQSVNYPQTYFNMLLGTLAISFVVLAGAVESSASNSNSAHKKVAIIGAGSAGSSTAYHLAQDARAANIPVDIDVYERSAHVGGRSTTINVWNNQNLPVELGASIFVSVNHILVNASRDFGLRTATRNVHDSENMPDLGIWDGKEFVFTTTDEGGWWDMAKLFWRYGYAPITTNSLMKKTVGQFSTMYDAPLFPWKSLSQAVQDVQLTEVAGLTGEQFLQQKGVGEKFAREIIQASTRVNYASNLGMIHGVETMVCMAINGAMQIEGGNWNIFDRMLKSSSSISTHLNSTITKVSKQQDGTYNLTLSSGSISTYDEVILASPLQFSKLNIDPAPNHTPDEIPYVRLHVTHFATPHKLSPLAFNLPQTQQVPEAVLTTIPPNEPSANGTSHGSPGFFSISILKSLINPVSTVPRQEYVYKIFTDRRVDAAFLTKYLGMEITDEEVEHGGDPEGNISWIHHKLFHSYPHEYPRVTFDEIKLDENLWYTSSIESFISTMETSALMGKNVARLIANGWEEEKEREALKVQGGQEQEQLEGWQYGPLLQQNFQEP